MWRLVVKGNPQISFKDVFGSRVSEEERKEDNFKNKRLSYLMFIKLEKDYDISFITIYPSISLIISF